MSRPREDREEGPPLQERGRKSERENERVSEEPYVGQRGRYREPGILASVAPLGSSRGGNGLAKRCRSWREGRESQRWPDSGSGGSGNGSRARSSSSIRSRSKGIRPERRDRRRQQERETRSSSSSSFSRSSSTRSYSRRWEKARGPALPVERSVDGVTLGPSYLPARRRTKIEIATPSITTF